MEENLSKTRLVMPVLREETTMLEETHGGEHLKIVPQIVESMNKT